MIFIMSSSTIHRTKSGKRYFIANGRKVFINSKLTKREKLQIYKLLLKNVKHKKHNGTVINMNTQSRRPSRRNQSKPFQSTIDPATRVTTSSGNPKDSGDKDIINSLINDRNKREIELQKERLQAMQDPNFNNQLVLRNQKQNISNLSEHDRMLAMYQDPRASSKNSSAEQQLELAIDYNLQDQFLRFHKVKTFKPRVRIPRFHESLSDEKGERSDQPDIQQAERVQVPEQQEQQQELEPEQQQDVAPEDLAPEQHQELEHPRSTESDVSAMSGPPPPPMRHSLFRKKPITMKSLQSQKASYRWHRLPNETFVNYLKRTENLEREKVSMITKITVCMMIRLIVLCRNLRTSRDVL